MDNPFENVRERRIIKLVMAIIIVLLVCGLFIWKFSDKTVDNSNNSTSGKEILDLSKDLYEMELKSNEFRMYTIEYQGKTKSSDNDDKAPQSLFHVVDGDRFWNQSSTVRLLKRIFDRYPLKTSGNGPEHMQDEWNFLEAVLQTPIMSKAMKFVHSKKKSFPRFRRIWPSFGFKKKIKHSKSNAKESFLHTNKSALNESIMLSTFQHSKNKTQILLRSKKDVGAIKRHQLDFLKNIWFMNSAGNINIRGSGFENVFMGALGTEKNVTGLHNWMYFAEQERLGYLDYKGYIKYEALGKKNEHFVAKVRLTFHNATAFQNTLLIGISPELEMSLYTACFVLNSRGKCSVDLGGKRLGLNVITNSLNHNKQKYIVAAYPEID